MTKLRNELSVERCNFLDQINVYIEANGELEQQLKSFDFVKKRNEELEREMKKLEEGNRLLKDELNQLFTLRNVCLEIKLVCDSSCSTKDLEYLESSLDKCIFKEDNEC